MLHQKVHLKDCIKGIDSVKKLVFTVTYHHASGTPLVYRLFVFRGLTESEQSARGEKAVRFKRKGRTDKLPTLEDMSKRKSSNNYYNINPMAHEIYVGREEVLDGLRKHQEHLGNPEAVLEYYDSERYLKSRVQSREAA